MRHFFLFILLVGSSLSAFGQKASIQNIRLVVDEPTSTVRILYDLTGIRAGDSVAVVLNGAQSGRIVPQSVQGDVGINVKDGTNRTIVWNAVQDNVTIDEDVVVMFSISAQPQKAISETLASSTAGRTPSRITSPTAGRKPSIILPVAGFVVAAGLGAFSQSKPTNYDAYQEKTVTAPTQAEIDEINGQIGIRQIAYVAAAAIAIADISYLLLRKKPTTKRVAVYLNAPSGALSLAVRRTF